MPACLHALLLMFFFLLLGTPILLVFGIPLTMARIVGGIIPMRLGFALFSASSPAAQLDYTATSPVAVDEDVAFVPWPCRSCSAPVRRRSSRLVDEEQAPYQRCA
jgi:multiple antibiotic resistance protein